MLTVPFLTDLDSRAAVKGSRDPLGIQQIWTRLGRHVVGNLTTVSTSVRDFTTLLLGYYFAEQLAAETGPGTELATFLKWEQLAAYSRATVEQGLGLSRNGASSKKPERGISRHALRPKRSPNPEQPENLWTLGSCIRCRRERRAWWTAILRVSRPRRANLSRIATCPSWPRRRPRCSESTRGPAAEVLPHRRRERRCLARPAVGRVLKPGLLPQEREFYQVHLLHGGPTGRDRGPPTANRGVAQRHADEGGLCLVSRSSGATWRRLRGREEKTGILWRIVFTAFVQVRQYLPRHRYSLITFSASMGKPLLT